MVQPVPEKFLERLRKALPGGVVAEASAAYLEEPRKYFNGKAAALLLPGSTTEVAIIVELCNRYSVGIVPYAGGTGLVGGQIRPDDPPAMVLSVERLNSVRSINPIENIMIAEAGVVLANAQASAAEHDRLFPLSLASEGTCRIGGNLATNAGGVQVLRYGNARELCLGLEAVLPDGSIYHGLHGLRKDNTGYDLRNLLIGSEGTLGIITAASLKLYPQPGELFTAMVSVESPVHALDLLAKMQAQSGGLVSAFELMHQQGLAFLQEALPQVRLPFGSTPEWSVLLEVGSASGLAMEECITSCLEKAIDGKLVDDVLIAQNRQQRDEFWNVRESIPEANRLIGSLSSHDISVPVSAIPRFIAIANAAIEKLGNYRINCFGHVGDGNLHYNVFPAKGESSAGCGHAGDAIRETVYDIVHQLGGSFSAEHGIGRLKIEALEHYGDPARLAAMRAIKKALDPNGIMNPGAVVRE
ncbi:MAG: FAD-binding oxidoreductase [Granulosicoccus sp.]